MMTSISLTKKALLLAAATPFAFAMAAPAFAQQATPPEQNGVPSSDVAAQNQPAAGDEIVVTGSIIRGTDTGISPVTTLTTENLDSRGINTVQAGIQALSSNNGPALTNSFTANGAFAAGASSVSLRGLSTNSTLVLFDGLRAAYYPLSDDGSRNFVDLNTIPDDIVERIDVLRDGASSSYGADAIAGVVNVITKRKFNGISGRAEAGISENGNNANQRLTLTAGTGDLDEKGYNAYVSGFYFRNEGVYQRDLPAPFNSDNLTGICSNRTGTTQCGPNNTANGLDANGALNGFAIGTGNFYVRPADAANTVASGRYQLLNPAAGCLNGTPYNPTAAQLATPANVTTPTTVCQVDNTNKYDMVTPNIERFGGSARFSAKVGADSEAYLLVNFAQSASNYTGRPSVIRGNAPAGILSPQFSTSQAQTAALAAGSGVLALPVYVCAARVNCGPTNGTLNPNNPFAAQGQVARLVGALPDTVTQNETRSRVYRAAFGLKGTVLNGFDYDFNATAMHTDLRVKTNGYVYIQNLLNVIADGSYNFVNPGLNTQAVRDYLTPENITDTTSDLYQAQLTVQKSLATLPGGDLRVAVGGSIFYEAVDAPSANDDYNGATQRYFTLNAFGTKGNRTVSSAFAEINAPVLDVLTLNGSGRYDHYSTGQSNFSPKVGAIFTPLQQVTVRGTYSRGFRIPSFGEANALPTTGYVTQQISAIPDAFLAQYGAGCSQASPTACPAYLTSYSIGQTTLASPELKPEKSRSFTGGLKFDPIRSVSLTVDYYNIKKTGAITTPDNSAAIAAYYAGAAPVAGFEVIADAPDVNNPNARPKIAFVRSQLINADTIKSSGIDFGINGAYDFGPVKWTSNLNASYIIELSTTIDGEKQRYEGTLGNFNLTAGSGTFEWKGNWLNTFDFGDFAVSTTVNYTSGYDLSATDQGDQYKDCGQAAVYNDCHVKSYITVDANVNFKVTDKFSFYVNALNLFDRLPPVDTVTYGAYLYNAIQGGDGIFGRQYRAGAKFNF
ncbi:TonB-dependent receptor domain-containing protein [Sphingomonas sp. CFBP9019]|uniref:TonB-dependent receptor domain-containing protein n=1 Tax=unclassified Sphingomonas TaxID=196159 RepID=UPI0004DF80C8|nr:TonB-dependent receptor [Sphingomonas sp. CFBP9019]MDY1009370.1 TonB-dependent receptor [Sphingomonas sp. CFBP9019]